MYAVCHIDVKNILPDPPRVWEDKIFSLLSLWPRQNIECQGNEMSVLSFFFFKFTWSLVIL